MFGAGVILYAILTHKNLFSGVDSNEVLSKNKECKLKLNFDKHLSPTCSKLAVDLLLKMLQVDPML